jgi:hypothetical protein
MVWRIDEENVFFFCKARMRNSLNVEREWKMRCGEQKRDVFNMYGTYTV